MKKTILLILILLLLFSSGLGLIYLNNVYFPVKLKARLINGLSLTFNCNVEIEKIKYTLMRGLVIQNILFYDKTKDEGNTILKIKEAHFNFLFLPLLKEKKIIIPVLYADEPYFYLDIHKDNTSNLSKIISGLNKPAFKNNTGFSLLIQRINISSGRCIFKDERVTPAFSKEIRDINLGLNINLLARKILFKIQGKLPTEKEAFSLFYLQGNYEFASQIVRANLALNNFNLSDFSPYLKNLPASIVSGNIINTDLDIEYKDNYLNIDGTIDAKNMQIRQDDFILLADMSIQPKIRHDFSTKNTEYTADLNLNRAELKGLRYIDKITDIAGKVTFNKDKILAENLLLRALDSDFSLSGQINNPQEPQLEFKLTSEALNLERLFSILPHPKDTKLTGKSKVTMHISGMLKKPPLDIKADFDLTEGIFEAPFLKEPVKSLRGRIGIGKDKADWQNIVFDYRNISYTSAGNLTDFKEPRINLNLTSKELNLKSELKIKDNILTLHSCDVKLAESKLDIRGNIDIRNSANPELDLTLKSEIKTNDIYPFLAPKLLETLQKIKFSAKMDVRGSLKGNPANPRDMKLALKTTAEDISVYNLHFNNVSFSLDQNEKFLNIPHLSANAYSGVLTATFSLNLKPEVPEYHVKFNSSGIDLKQLKMDTGYKDKEITGIMDINGFFYGNIQTIDSIRGNGFVSVKKGNVWQMNLFGGLGDLFLMPEYKNVAFDEAFGEFIVEDKFVSTEGFVLKSVPITLDWYGKVGFDGSLDFTVYTKVNKDLINDSADLRKFVTAVWGELRNVMAIRITGTIQKARYRVIPMPVDLIRNIKNFILGK